MISRFLPALRGEALLRLLDRSGPAMKTGDEHENYTGVIGPRYGASTYTVG
jgi:hypothetical protein